MERLNKPTNVWHLAPGEERRDDTLFMGVELELEVDGSNQIDGLSTNGLLNIFDQHNGDGLWYYHGDGSLRYGLEMVTHPMTFRYFKNSFDMGLFDKLQGRAGPYSFSDRMPRAGIHVHVSRAAFDEELTHKFLYFHYARRKTLCERVGGRQNSTYATFNRTRYSKPQMRYTQTRVADWVQQKMEIGSGSHFHAVNTSNRDTIELRYFRSTVSPLRFAGIIEWVHGVYSYCKDIPGLPKTKEFLDYLAASPDYRNALAIVRGEPTHAPDPAPSIRRPR